MLELLMEAASFVSIAAIMVSRSDGVPFTRAFEGRQRRLRVGERRRRVGRPRRRRVGRRPSFVSRWCEYGGDRRKEGEGKRKGGKKQGGGKRKEAGGSTSKNPESNIQYLRHHQVEMVRM